MNKNTIVILSYHEVNETIKGSDKSNRMHPDTCLPVEKFEEQINYLSKNNFLSVSLKEIIENNKSLTYSSIKCNKFTITFDDGHVGNYNFVFPILKKYGFIASFFITTNLIGKENMITWDNLKEMIKGGMDIQSHAVSHNPLSLLTNEQIKQELLESKNILESKLGIKVDFLSLPHGDYDRRVQLIAKEVGYKSIFTSEPKYFLKCNDDLLIGRIEIKKGYDTDCFISIVEKKFKRLRYLKLIYKIKFSFRSFFGVNNYRRLYRLFNGIKFPDYK